MECQLSYPFFAFFWFLTFLSIMKFSFADDTLTPSQSIRDGETLVSSSQSFELGFFSPGKSNNRYLGIWYKNSPTTVVWVANRNNPITDRNGVLTVSEDGELLLSLLNRDDTVVWSSNSSSVSEHPVAQLLDSGNFVLRGNNISLSSASSTSYIWQSFDDPLDMLLQGMKLGWNLKSGVQRYLTSWKNDDDPSPGDFSLRLDIQGLPQLVILSGGSRKVARSGPWNGLQFNGIPMMHNLVFKPRLVDKQDQELYYRYEAFDSTVITRLIIDPSGTLQRLVWNDKMKKWDILYSWPFDLCDRYEQCGVNDNCRISRTPVCQCLKGFIPKSQDEWDTEGSSQSRKCIKKPPSSSAPAPAPADCRSRGEGFLKLLGMKLPDFNWSNKSMNTKECEAKCFNNCSCTAYATSNISSGSGCLMWFGDLIDMRECSKDFIWGQDIFIRVPASELVHHSNKKIREKIIAIVSIMLGMLILGIVLCIYWKNKKITGDFEEDIEGVPLFDLSTVVAATNNFSQANMIGEGGFGPVYKGTLSTGQEIAVKRLSQNSGQGVEEFKNEVVLIGKLQHRNLVALLGSCIQGVERMLIYEYMPNHSLDYFIFDGNRSKLLPWKNRVDIAIGIARGLLYLHQDSKLQIVHRDLKASNILLDIDLNPKISDFGLARIFRGDDKEDSTKRVMGTHGYMSPEYATDGTFSLKSDVFSFGVLLLEIITGKKNRGFRHLDHHHNLLGHAWLLWNDERVLEIVDTCILEDSSFIEFQVLRCIQVSLLCVQKFSKDRPDMSSVVFMLANEGVMLPQPRQPGFFTERCFAPSISSSKEEYSNTENAMSITIPEGR